MQRLLLVVDPQVDFINGTLPVPGAAAAMDALADFLRAAEGRYAAKIVTADWHPYNHSSFRDQGGQWPRHCVAHTTGAALWPALVGPLFATPGPCQVLHKGTDRATEEYSIFQNPEGRRRILELTRGADTVHIDICGLAGDVCVLSTLRDGVALLGPERFTLLADFSPSLDGGATLAAALPELGTACEGVAR